MRSDYLEQFRDVGRMMWQAGLVSSHGGNMSVRLPDGALLITRTGAMLARIDEDDLVPVASDGSSPGEPSMDTAVHRATYEASDAFADGSRARAVIHAHPRHAIALSLMADTVEPADAEGKMRLGSVPVVDAEQVGQALGEAPIVLARGHGSYARSEDLWQAFQWTSVLEESAEVLWLLRCLRR